MKIEIVLDDKALTAAIKRFGGPSIMGIIRPSLERRANEALSAAVKGFTSRGIGRGIFGRNDSGAWKIITLSKADVRGDSLEMTLTAGGLAGLQEVGGRIAPHEIRPKRRKALAFQMLGNLTFAAVVDHPGATVKKYESLRPAAEKIPAQVIADIQPKLAALWGKAA